MDGGDETEARGVDGWEIGAGENESESELGKLGLLYD